MFMCHLGNLLRALRRLSRAEVALRIVWARSLCSAGTLGDVVYLTAEHGQWFAADPQFRLFAADLGGGGKLHAGRLCSGSIPLL